MPAAASKRVRGTQVRRHFVIGNTAHKLPAPGFPDPPPEGHTKGWTVYVRPLPNGPDINTWLKKVQFKYTTPMPTHQEPLKDLARSK